MESDEDDEHVEEAEDIMTPPDSNQTCPRAR